jgi:hypothetical protein
LTLLSSNGFNVSITPFFFQKKLIELNKSLHLFQYLKTSAAVAYWSKVEARYSQIARIHNQTKVQADSESALLQSIQGNNCLNDLYAYNHNFCI